MTLIYTRKWTRQEGQPQEVNYFVHELIVIHENDLMQGTDSYGNHAEKKINNIIKQIRRKIYI